MAGVNMDDANEKLRLFGNYLTKYSIFMTDELREKFRAAHQQFAHATSFYHCGKRARDWETQASGIETISNESLTRIIRDIERAVQKRLHYQEA